MNEVTWKYVKPLKNENVVDEFLNKYKVVLPMPLVQCLIAYNGGRPSEKLFYTNNGNEYVFKSLLSYNADDVECIYKVYPHLFRGTSLYPIGTDSAGNFVCYDTINEWYVLLKHETSQQEKLKFI